MSSTDYLDLCRLCLVKESAFVPIFDGEGDGRQIFHKIAACLPVKVTKDDKLPKKICNECVQKVELFYQFCNTTTNAEKQLLEWIGEVDLNDKQTYVSAVINQDQSSNTRLDGNVMQQTNEQHQNNIDMNMMESIGLEMPMMIQQNQTQMTINYTNNTNAQSMQSNTAAQQKNNNKNMDESDDDHCGGDDDMGQNEELSVKEEIQDTNRTIEPTFVSIPCEEAGPSGLQQKSNDIQDGQFLTGQSTDGDPKSGIKKKRGRPKKKTTNTSGRSNGSSKQIIKVETTTATTSPISTTPRGRRKGKISNSQRSSLRTRSVIKNEITPTIGLVPIKTLILSPNFYEENETTREEIVDPLLSSESEEDKNSWWSKCKPKDDDEWQTEQEKKLKALKEKKLRLEELKKQRKLLRQNPVRLSCTECDKTFSKKEVLKFHMRTHTGNRPYNCKICKKSFTRRTHLKQHALIHSGSTPYICNAIIDGVLCGKAFAQKPGLIGHRKSHTGVLPPLPKVSIDLLLRGVDYE